MSKICKALVVWGTSNTGKTKSINQLIDNLVSQGASVLFRLKKTNDSCCVVNFKGKIIIVISAGDDGEQILKYYNIAEIQNHLKNADLFICASRTKGSSCEFLKNTFGDKNIIWCSKFTVNNHANLLPKLIDYQNELNNAQADFILDFIDKLIGDKVI